MAYKRRNNNVIFYGFYAGYLFSINRKRFEIVYHLPKAVPASSHKTILPTYSQGWLETRVHLILVD